MPSGFFVDAILRINDIDINKQRLKASFQASLNEISNLVEEGLLPKNIKLPVDPKDLAKQTRLGFRKAFSQINFKELEDISKRLQGATGKVSEQLVRQAVGGVEQLKEVRSQLRSTIAAQGPLLSGAAKISFLTSAIRDLKTINKLIDGLKAGVDTAFSDEKQKANAKKIADDLNRAKKEQIDLQVSTSKLSTLYDKILSQLKEINQLRAATKQSPIDVSQQIQDIKSRVEDRGLAPKDKLTLLKLEASELQKQQKELSSIVRRQNEVANSQEKSRANAVAQQLAVAKVNKISEQLLEVWQRIDALTAKVTGNVVNVNRAAQLAQILNSDVIVDGKNLGKKNTREQLNELRFLLSSAREEKAALEKLAKESVKPPPGKSEIEQLEDRRRAALATVANEEKLNRILHERVRIAVALDKSKSLISGTTPESEASIRSKVFDSAKPRVIRDQGEIVGAETFTDVINRQSKELQRQKRELQDFSKSLTNTARAHRLAAQEVLNHENALFKFGRQTFLAVKRYAAFLLPTTGLFAVIGAVRQSIQAFKEFEVAQTRLEQVLGATKSEVDELGESFRRIASGTGVALSNITKAIQIITQAGFGRGPSGITDLKNFAEVLAKTELAPTFDSLEKTTEGLVAILSQFGLKLSDTNRILEVTNQLSKDFAIESADIFTAVRSGGSAFATLNGSFEDFASLLTAVRSQTRESASVLGTFFKSSSIRLFRKDSDDILRRLDENLVFTDNITDRWIGIAKAFERLDDVQRIRVAEQLTGLRQAGRALALTEAISKKGDDIAASLSQATGSLDRDASKRLDDFTNSLDRAREAFNSLLITIADNTVFKKIASTFADLINIISKVGESASNFLGPGLLVGASLLTRKIAPDILGGFGAGTREDTLRKRPEIVAMNRLTEANIVLRQALIDTQQSLGNLTNAVTKQTSVTIGNTQAEISGRVAKSVTPNIINIQGRTGRLPGLPETFRTSLLKERIANTTSPSRLIHRNVFGDIEPFTQAAARQILTERRLEAIEREGGVPEFFSGKASPATTQFALGLGSESSRRRPFSRIFSSLRMPIPIGRESRNQARIARIQRTLRSLSATSNTRPSRLEGFGIGGIATAGILSSLVGGSLEQTGREEVSASKLITGGVLSSAGIGSSLGLVGGIKGAGIGALVGALVGLVKSTISLRKAQEDLNKQIKETSRSRFVSKGDIESFQSLFSRESILSEGSIRTALQGDAFGFIDILDPSRGFQRLRNLNPFRESISGLEALNIVARSQRALDDTSIPVQERIKNQQRILEEGLVSGLKLSPGQGGEAAEAILRTFRDSVRSRAQRIIATDLVSPEEAFSRVRSQIGPETFDPLAKAVGLTTEKFTRIIEEATLLGSTFERTQNIIKNSNSITSTFNNEFKRAFEQATTLFKRGFTDSSTLQSIFDGSFIPQRELVDPNLLRGEGIRRELTRSGVVGANLLDQADRLEAGQKLAASIASAFVRRIDSQFFDIGDDPAISRTEFINILKAIGEQQTQNLGQADIIGDDFTTGGTTEDIKTSLAKLERFISSDNPIFRAIEEGKIDAANLASIEGDILSSIEQALGLDELQKSLADAVNSGLAFQNAITEEQIKSQRLLIDRLDNLNKVIEESSNRVENLNRSFEGRRANLLGFNSRFAVSDALFNLDRSRSQIDRANIDNLGIDRLTSAIVEINNAIKQSTGVDSLTEQTISTLSDFGIDTAGKSLFELIVGLSGPLDQAKVKSDQAMESLNKGLQLAEQSADSLLQLFRDQLGALSDLGLASLDKTPRQLSAEREVFNRFSNILQREASAAGIDLSKLSPEDLFRADFQEILNIAQSSIGRKGQGLLSSQLQELERVGADVSGISPWLLRQALFFDEGQNVLSGLSGVNQGLTPEEILKAFREAESSIKTGVDAAKNLGNQLTNVATTQAVVAATEARRAGGQQVRGGELITPDELAQAAINKEDLDKLSKAFSNIPDTLTIALPDFNIDVRITGGNEIVNAIMPTIANQIQTQINESVGKALEIIDPSIKQRLQTLSPPPLAGQPRG